MNIQDLSTSESAMVFAPFNKKNCKRKRKLSRGLWRNRIITNK